MLNRQQKCANILSNLLIIIAVIILVSCTSFFVIGQLNANRAIVDAGKAVMEAASVDDPAQAAVDYTGAITYLEAAQQAYSENSVIKITSLVYVLASTIILGYGAKMLHLGATEKQELREELLKETEQQFLASSNQMLQQQNDIYAAITACGNATHLCLLLQSTFELKDGVHYHTGTTERLQIELTRALQRFRDFLAIYTKEGESRLPLSKTQLEMIKQSWSQAKRAVLKYIEPEQQGAVSHLEENFGHSDQLAVDNLVSEIQQYIDSFRHNCG